jgi:hypothetical protein
MRDFQQRDNNSNIKQVPISPIKLAPLIHLPLSIYNAPSIPRRKCAHKSRGIRYIHPMTIICSEERVANMLSVTRIVVTIRPTIRPTIRSKRPTIFTLTTRPIQRLTGRRRSNFQHNLLFLSSLCLFKTSKPTIIHIVCDKGCHCLEDALHRSRKKQSIFYLYIH